MIKYTELKSTKRQNLRNVLPLSKPFTVLIEPSSLCNFKCVQCFQSLKEENYFTENRQHMPFDTYVKVIEQLKSWNEKKLKVLKLSLYGEPLLNPDFCEMLEMAREANIAERIETTTNASLLTEKVAEKLVEYQLDYIRVSIYSPYQDKHEEITGTKFDIHKIHENLKTLQAIKKCANSKSPFVAAKMLDAYNSDNDAFMEMYSDVADEVYIEKPHNWIKVDGVDFIKDYYKDDIIKALDDSKKHSTQRVACPMAFTTMAVRSNGDVSPCCVDFIGGTNLGNVDDMSLQQIWNSRQWLEFQKLQLKDRKHENYSCLRCNIYRNDYYTRDNIDGFPIERLR